MIGPKFTLYFVFKLLVIIVLLFHGPIKSQQLSQDPLYVLVFEDNFDSINYSDWYTSWAWGNNLWNSNYTIACDSTSFPGKVVDIAFNSMYPYDSNRVIINFGGLSYERLIFNRSDFYAPMIAYHDPCPSAFCTSHNAPCDSNSSGLHYCVYDTLMPFKFSGAMLKGKEKYKYGYFEIRYKLIDLADAPYNAYGPNFWMWASDTNAFNSEIDIFEQRGTDWRMEMNFHFRKMNPDHNTVWEDTVAWHGLGNPITTITPYSSIIDQLPPYNGGNWHTVGCEWTPDHIDNYYDSDDTIRRFSVTKLPVDQLTAMPLIIDLYMPAVQYCIPFDSIHTYRPFHYDIDYVRVYQINQVCDCETTSGYFPSFLTNQYSSILYRDLTIGGGGNAILDSGSFHLAGQDYVLLQSGFEVSGTADVIISTTPCQPDQKRFTENIPPVYLLPDLDAWKDMLNSKQHE